MTQDQIKTRADGSIDTDYYLAQGRLARSETAHDFGRGLARAIRKLARRLMPQTNGPDQARLHPAE